MWQNVRSALGELRAAKQLRRAAARVCGWGRLLTEIEVVVPSCKKPLSLTPPFPLSPGLFAYDIVRSPFATRISSRRSIVFVILPCWTAKRSVKDWAEHLVLACEYGEIKADRVSSLVCQAAQRSYRWCNPPTSGSSTTLPNSGGWTGRGIGASFSSDK